MNEAQTFSVNYTAQSKDSTIYNYTMHVMADSVQDAIRKIQDYTDYSHDTLIEILEVKKGILVLINT